MDPHDHIKVPAHFKNQPIAITACARQVEKREHDEKMELCDFNTWQMTEPGTPHIKHVGNNYADPRPAWGHY